MAETVELHGGPKHGAQIEVPFQNSPSMEVDAIFSVDGAMFRRRAKYTRVHSIHGAVEPHFEWVGYVTNLLPLEADA